VSSSTTRNQNIYKSLSTRDNYKAVTPAIPHKPKSRGISSNSSSSHPQSSVSTKNRSSISPPNTEKVVSSNLVDGYSYKSKLLVGVTIVVTALELKLK
jgi:hypothetical protein